MMPPHGPRPYPIDPGCKLPAPTPTRGPAAPRLQPLLGLASPDAGPLQPHRPHGVDPLPEPDPGHQRRDRVVATARRRQVPGRVPRRPGRVRHVHGQRRRPLVPAPLRRRRSSGPIAYFCAEYGFHESLGHLLRWPWRAGRRPHEDRQRHGPAGDRRRAALPQGLLPPDDRCRRPPGARLPGLRPEPAAARARPGRQRPAADRDARAARARPGGRGLGRAGRARPGASARHGPRRRTPMPTGRSRTSSTCAAARCACTRSSSSASAACARSGRSGFAPAVWHLNEGHSAFLLAERAREYVAEGKDLDEGVEGRQARQRVHHPHAGLGGQRALRCRPGPPRRRARCSTPAASRSTRCSRARAWRRRRPRTSST